MKDFFEKIKDLLYDSVDYIMMIAIVGIVVLVIGWRLDLLFAKDASNMDNTNITQENRNENEDNNLENKSPSDNDKIEDGEKDNENEVVEEPENQDLAEEPVVNSPSEDATDKSNIIKVNIPSGSLPGKIGSILEEKGLIPSKDDFVEKSQELKLDTKLRSGDFEIKEGSTVEEIVRIIAK